MVALSPYLKLSQANRVAIVAMALVHARSRVIVVKYNIQGAKTLWRGKI